MTTSNETVRTYLSGALVVTFVFYAGATFQRMNTNEIKLDDTIGIVEDNENRLNDLEYKIADLVERQLQSTKAVHDLITKLEKQNGR